MSFDNSARRSLQQLWWGIVAALGFAVVAGVVTLAFVSGLTP